MNRRLSSHPLFALPLTLALLVNASCASRQTSPAQRSPAVTEREHFLTMFARSYFPGRSGQIFLVPEEGAFLLSRPDDFYRFMHGSPWNYDVDIPLVFFGAPFVRAGSFAESVTQQDVAPTLATLLGLPVPASMSGRVLSSALAETSRRPRVVVLAVLDGMRADYFDRLAAKLPNLARLRRDGASFENARVSAIPSVTAAGHATLATGADPRFHGISANAFFDRRKHESMGPFPDLSPATYRVLTLADHWNLATDGRAVVIVQGTTPRATVGLAGYGGCAISAHRFVLAMFDDSKAGWVTNPECYRLPDYLEKEDATAVWEAAGSSWMGHETTTGRTLVRTALFPAFQGDALVRMLERESVGEDDVPDLVLVNFKTPDYVSHQYGPDSPELETALGALDEQIGRVVRALEESAGAGGYVLAVTADHGMPGEPDASGHRREYVEDLVEAIHDRLDPEGRRLVLDFSDPANLQISIDEGRLAELGLDLADVARFVESFPFVRAAFTEDEVRAVRLPR